MLKIHVPEGEEFDERTNEFIYHPACTLVLEHSLISVSKWESKWKVPFVNRKEITQEQLLDYIRCMTLTTQVDPSVYKFITPEQIKQITAYIEDSMTATRFKEDKKKNKKPQALTSETIYYMMFAQQIPIECEKWHLNRLMTLIRVCSEKNAPQKKMSKSEIYAQNKMLNAQRRAKYNTKG